ncbi:MAG: NeuD/PglB/VioB family sugar acetyltransferase [Anaerolineales bacterium]
MSTPVIIPLINPNEPEAYLAALHISAGQAVQTGSPIATLETTKAAYELTAEQNGYIVALRYQQGDTVRAGDTLCHIAETPEEPQPENSPTTAAPVPDDLRITQPALRLAQENALDLNRLPREALITEKMVRALLEKPAGADEATAPIFDAAALVIYGGGGHGKSLAELVRALGVYRIHGFVDDGIPAGTQILGIPVLGGSEILSDLYARGVRLAVNAVGGIGNVTVRVRVFEKLAQAGFVCPTVIHPTAFVEPSARLAAGVQVFPHAYIGSEAQIGFGCIVNTGAIVSHDCVLGEYVNLSPGATLAGAVSVGARALIGMRATVNLGAHLGATVRIGNGATVKGDVPAGAVVPAGGIHPRGS